MSNLEIYRSSSNKFEISELFVLIPIYSDYKFTINSIKQLFNQAFLLDLNLVIIVIDSSENEIFERKIREVVECMNILYYHVQVSKHYYWTRSIQEGFKYITSNYKNKSGAVLVMNNDIEISEGYIEASLDIMHKYNYKCLVSGGTINNNKNPQILEAGYRGVFTLKPICINLADRSEKELIFSYPDYIAFRCILIPLSVLHENVFATNSRALPHYWADILMSLKAKLAGYVLIVTPEISIRHTREPAIMNHNFNILSQFFHPKSYKRLVSFFYFWFVVTLLFLKSFLKINMMRIFYLTRKY